MYHPKDAEKVEVEKLKASPEVRAIILEIEQELLRAMSRHGSHQSAHESYAVILEELDELWDEVKKRQFHRDPTSLEKEAMQVAAMAARFIHDVVRKGVKR